MKIRHVVLTGTLLLMNIGCRGGSGAHEEAKVGPPSQGAVPVRDTAMPAPDSIAQARDTVPPIPILDSTTASIRFEREEDGYRFFLQPKDTSAKLASRCFDWILDSLPGSKKITSLDHQESNCYADAYNLVEQEAALSWVGVDSSTIAKNYGSVYVQILSVAKNPILSLQNIRYKEGYAPFLEMPLGETVATLTFHSDDACDVLEDVNTGCEKRVLPPLTVGEVHLKIKITVKEGQFEIREWP